MEGKVGCLATTDDPPIDEVPLAAWRAPTSDDNGLDTSRNDEDDDVGGNFDSLNDTNILSPLGGSFFLIFTFFFF